MHVSCGTAESTRGSVLREKNKVRDVSVARCYERSYTIEMPVYETGSYVTYERDGY